MIDKIFGKPLKEYIIDALDYLILIALIFFAIPFGIALAISLFAIGILVLIVILLGIPVYFLFIWKDEIRYLL